MVPPLLRSKTLPAIITPASVVCKVAKKGLLIGKFLIIMQGVFELAQFPLKIRYRYTYIPIIFCWTFEHFKDLICFLDDLFEYLKLFNKCDELKLLDLSIFHSVELKAFFHFLMKIIYMNTKHTHLDMHSTMDFQIIHDNLHL